MSSIAGILNRANRNATQHDIKIMLDALHHWEADGRDHFVKGPMAMGQLMLYNTPESRHEEVPYKDADSGLCIVADCRIDNREELLQQLNLHQQKEPIIPDSQLILETYKHYGNQCTDHLVGAFAFAIYDPNQTKLFCARDHIGFKPFYYLNNSQLFIYSTEIKGIKAHPSIRLTENETFITDALMTLRSEKDRTFYNEIYRLAPAHQMEITPSVTRLKKYWELNPHFELNLPSEEAYVEAFKEKLNEAVECRLRSSYPIGAELSGGVDSSAIVGLAAKRCEINAFSHAIPDWAKDKHFPYDDETPHSTKVMEFLGVGNHFFITSENAGMLKLLRKGLHLHEGIMQGTLSEIFDPLYTQAEGQNCRTLLSGYGGDEMVTSPGPRYLQELASGFRYLKLLKELRKKNKGKGFIKVVRQFGKYTLLGLSQHFKPKYRTPDWAHHIYQALAIDQGLFEEKNLKKRFYNRKKLPAAGNIRQRQYLRINYDYVPQRLEYCAIKAQTHKIEYRYPLLDKRLIEFYLSLPGHMKVKNGYGRYIMRKAMEGILPPEIQWRTDKRGTVVPSVFIKYKQETPAMRELIEKARNSPIKHYVDYDKMLTMLERITNFDENTNERINPQAFQSSLMLLMYQLEKLEKDES